MKTAEIRLNRDRHVSLDDHTAVLILDTINWNRFQGFFRDGAAGVTILEAHLDGDDRVVVRAGCATQDILDRLIDAWA